MKFAIFVAILVVASQACAEKVRYDNYKVYRVTPKNATAFEILKAMQQSKSPVSFWSPVRSIGQPADLMVPPSHLEEVERIIESLEADSYVMMDNVQDYIDAEGLRPVSRVGGMDWISYHTYDEITEWLQTLSRQYPDKVTLIDAGNTYENRTIWGVKVSFSRANENKSVFLESNIHAREWISSAVETYILNELLTSTDPTFRRFAESYDWYVFPVVNPDGFVYTHTTDRMWRKTKTPYGGDCIGADANRNWGFAWNQGGSSNDPCAEDYNGPRPFSEPSVANLARFITSIQSKLVAYLDFHSYSQLMLLPFGHTTEHLANYDVIYPIALRAAEVLAKRYGTEYLVGNIAETIYIASGGSVDWVKGVYEVPVVIAYELRDTGYYGFVLPAEQIIPTALETIDSIIALLDGYENTLN